MTKLAQLALLQQLANWKITFLFLKIAQLYIHRHKIISLPSTSLTPLSLPPLLPPLLSDLAIKKSDYKVWFRTNTLQSSHNAFIPPLVPILGLSPCQIKSRTNQLVPQRIIQPLSLSGHTCWLSLATVYAAIFGLETQQRQKFLQHKNWNLAHSDDFLNQLFPEATSIFVRGWRRHGNGNGAGTWRLVMLVVGVVVVLCPLAISSWIADTQFFSLTPDAGQFLLYIKKTKNKNKQQQIN